MEQDAAKLRERVDEIGWYHSIDLGHGVRTKGLSSSTPLTESQLPDLRGRTVLDIGAWDGYYSFLAERLGASRVVALDHYAWGVDIAARQKYWEDCAARGVLPDHSRDLTQFWDESLPGKRGFDLAREALSSSVESHVGDFMTMDLSELGTFDVVFYLGVLYHMEEPLTSLKRVRSVTGQVAVVETQAMHHAFHPREALLEFVAGNELNADFGNWYVPSMTALIQLCRGAGFRAADEALGPPPLDTSLVAKIGRRLHPERAMQQYRAVVHARV